MSGCYKGARAHIQKDNTLAFFCPCACHSLNLCGTHAAECSSKAVTFFGSLEKLYGLFSSSPQRWQVLTETVGCCLHKLSPTQWSARVDAIKPFAAHLVGLIKALKKLKKLNLFVETRSTVQGLYTYLNSFECVLMSSIWLKILTAINF